MPLLKFGNLYLSNLNISVISRYRQNIRSRLLFNDVFILTILVQVRGTVCFGFELFVYDVKLKIDGKQIICAIIPT